MTCQHTVTKGREGSRNSWCVACGALTLVVHSEACQNCQHYEPEMTAFGPHPRVGMCRSKAVGPMRVTADMHVTYYAEPGPHRHGLCFEPVVPRSSRSAQPGLVVKWLDQSPSGYHQHTHTHDQSP